MCYISIVWEPIAGLSFNRILSGNMADITEEELLLSAIIRDFIELRDSDASSDSIIVDYLCTSTG